MESNNQKQFNIQKVAGVLCLLILISTSMAIYGQTKTQSMLALSPAILSPTINHSLKSDTSWKVSPRVARLRRGGYILGAFGIALIGGGIPVFITGRENGSLGGVLETFLGAAMIGGGSILTLGGTTMIIFGQRRINREKQRLSINFTPESGSFVYRF